MFDLNRIKKLFSQNGGIMRTCELIKERVYYCDISRLINGGYIEKIKYGYYRWIKSGTREIELVTTLFSDGILCMDTALSYYGYTSAKPDTWSMAVSKDSCKSRFKLKRIAVKPYFVEPSVLELGLEFCDLDGVPVRMYNRERVICDLLRYRHKMDKEVFYTAIRRYLLDPAKNIARLLEYAAPLRALSSAKQLAEVCKYM